MCRPIFSFLVLQCISPLPLPNWLSLSSVSVISNSSCDLLLPFTSLQTYLFTTLHFSAGLFTRLSAGPILPKQPRFHCSPKNKFRPHLINLLITSLCNHTYQAYPHFAPSPLGASYTRKAHLKMVFCSHEKNKRETDISSSSDFLP